MAFLRDLRIEEKFAVASAIKQMFYIAGKRFEWAFAEDYDRIFLQPSSELRAFYNADV